MNCENVNQVPSLETLAHRVVLEMGLHKYFSRNIRAIFCADSEHLDITQEVIARKVHYLSCVRLSPTSLVIWR